MESKIEVLIEGHLVLPVLEQVICFFDKGALAN
jgi:hypothetical protein